MRELFIYYRLHSADADAARAAFETQHAALAQRHPALVCRLLCRSEAQGGLQTWMEHYSTDPSGGPDGVSTLQQLDIEAHASRWLRLVVGTRHVEVFTACAS